MGLDYVDIFYSHRFDPSTPLEETMGALASAVKSGKALYAGVSSYDAPTTARAAKILRELGYAPRFTIEDAICELTEAFRAGKVTDPLTNPLYFNIKRMQEVNLK
jgi:aryl-alcohol dehydrogenase-like predicted oxidoreductase